jgi:uncharacterized membrane protein YbhN (UPF0104 family)
MSTFENKKGDLIDELDDEIVSSVAKPRSQIRRVVAFAIIALVIVLLYRDFAKYAPQIPDLIENADPIYIAIILLLQLVSYCGSGLTSYLLLRLHKVHIGLLNNMKISVLVEIGSHLLPLAGGPVATFMALRKMRVPSKAAHFVVSVEMLCLILTYVICYIVSIAIPPYPRIDIDLPPIAGAALVLVVLAGMAVYLLGKHLRKFISDVQASLNNLKGNYRTGLLVLAITIVYFLIDIVMLKLAFLTFGAEVPIPTVIFGFLSSMGLALLSTTSAVPGIPEAAMTLAFTKLGVPVAAALSGILLFRILTYWVWVPLSTFLTIHHLKPKI